MSEHVTTHLAGQALNESPGRNTQRALLFERIVGRIYRYFRKRVWNAEAAEDLAQQTLLVLECSLRDGSYDPGRSFNTWMWLKAHTVYAQYCRERQRAPITTAEVPEQPAADPATEVADKLDAKAVLQALERELGSETYTCFLLYYQGELTHGEVAEVVGRARKTVAQRIGEAQRFCQRFIA